MFAATEWHLTKHGPFAKTLTNMLELPALFCVMALASVSTVVVARGARLAAIADGRFVPFAAQHLAAVAVIAIASAVVAYALRTAERDPLKHARCAPRICRAIAILLMAYAIAGEAWLIARGHWVISAGMPFQLCDMAIFVTAAALWAVSAAEGDFPRNSGASVNRETWLHRHRQKLYEIAYYWGLGGTGQAILTPELQQPFPTVDFLKFFAGHGLIIVAVAAMTVGLRMRPSRGSAFRTWVITNALVGPMLLFNWLTDSNYMYLIGPARTRSILDLLGPQPLYFVGLELLALVLMYALYLPFWIWNRRRAA